MTQNDLLLTTRNVMDSMDSVIQSNDAPFEDRIINVVAAYEAMKQVRESRKGFWGWLWKFIFRERNEIEQTNLETFESQVNRLRNEGYPVDEIAADLTGKTVLGLEVESATKARETQPEVVSTVNEEKKVENENVEKQSTQDLDLEKQTLSAQLNNDLNGKEITDKSAPANQQPQINAMSLDK
jgi:hypothetical protein